MTDYDMLVKVLTHWIDPKREDLDVNDYYIIINSIHGNRWVKIHGESDRDIEFVFDANGKIVGCY